VSVTSDRLSGLMNLLPRSLPTTDVYYDVRVGIEARIGAVSDRSCSPHAPPHVLGDSIHQLAVWNGEANRPLVVHCTDSYSHSRFNNEGVPEMLLVITRDLDCSPSAFVEISPNFRLIGGKDTGPLSIVKMGGIPGILLHLKEKLVNHVRGAPPSMTRIEKSW
jgi:hypothetical protein